MAPESSHVPAATNQVSLSGTGQLPSESAMKAVIWLGFGLCFVGFCFRSYIRLVCFRRFLVEDWLALFALALQLASACVSQLRVHYAYMIDYVANGIIPPPATLAEDSPKGGLGMFLQAVFCITGIHAVKLSFLFFFYRLGRTLRNYLIYWWVVMFVVVASYAVNMGLIEYTCMLSGVDVTMTYCNLPEQIEKRWRNMIVYCMIDAVSDVLIICLPIAILWRVRLTMRKRLILTGIFSLTLLTVAVTVIRGTIYVGRTDWFHNQSIAWTWFWLSIEFITAFIIACLVSFRMLFVQHENKAKDKQQQQRHHLSPTPPHRGSNKSGSKSRKRTFFDSLLDTFHDWEGTTRHDRDGEFMLNGTLPSGRMSVDFMRYEYVPGRVGGGSGEWPLTGGGGGGLGDDGGRPDSAKTLATSSVGDIEMVDVKVPGVVRVVGAGNGGRGRGYGDYGGPGGMC